MEKDNEVKGVGNSYDFGARMMDPRLGRWLSIDAYSDMYSGMTPYGFTANSPLSCKDPDGNLIIFINGLWGAGIGPLWSYWGDEWIGELSDEWDDYKWHFLDGSLGGMLSLPTTLSSDVRRNQGFKDGVEQANMIISNLSYGETIKFVTNSMGAAYQRGYSEGLFAMIENQILTHTAEREQLISGLKVEIANLEILETTESPYLCSQEIAEIKYNIKVIQSKLKYEDGQIKKLKSITTELVVDIDPWQQTSVDVNADRHVYIQSDQSEYNSFEKDWVAPMIYNPPVLGPGVENGSVDLNGNFLMQGHHSADLQPVYMPIP
jgi:RHS repeat-associated protein